jgi:hypothetical protein
MSFRITLFFLGIVLSGYLKTHTVQAQRLRTYEGEYVNQAGERGDARFTYFERGGERILNGEFHFEVSFTDSIQANHFIKKTYSGNYRNNLKDGDWRYSFKDYEVVIKDVKDLQAETEINGNYQEVHGRYRNGKPDGRWQFEEVIYSQSRQLSAVRRGQANFREGRLHNDFVFEGILDSIPYQIQGQFTRGFMNGRWVISYISEAMPVQEIREYQDGFLIRLIKKNERTNAELVHVEFTNVREQLRQLGSRSRSRNLPFQISDTPFDILFNDGFPDNAPELQVQQAANRFIGRAIRLFTDNDQEIYALEGVNRVYPASTRRFEYQQSPEVQENISVALAVTDSLGVKAQILLQNESFRINRQASDTLAFLYNYLVRLEERSQFIEGLLNFAATDDFRFYNPPNFFGDAVRRINRPDTIRYEYDGEERFRVVHYQRPLGYPARVLTQVVPYVRELDSLVNQISNYLNPILEQLRGEGVAREMEIRMNRKMDEVRLLYNPPDTARTDTMPVNSLHRQLYERFAVRQMNRIIQDYSNEQNLEAKLDIGGQGLQLLNTLINVFEPVYEIPIRHEKLDELYMVDSFDPFTYSYEFRVRVKPRLYSAAAEDLYSHLINQLRTETDIQMIPVLVNQLQNLVSRLFELRNEDTRRLERRLRQRNEPEFVKRLLDIDAEPL